MFRSRARSEEQVEKESRPKEPRRERRRSERRTDAPRKSTRSENRFLRYFQETGVELRKVAWPSRETTIRLTLIVLGTVVVFAIFLGALDFVFQRLAALLVG